MARLYRYSQWDGSQEPFEADADALLDALAEDVIDHGDIRRALRDLIRRGANGGDAPWQLADGYMEVAPRSGDIVSTARFGDVQYHLEFACPSEVKGESQGRRLARGPGLQLRPIP